MYFKKEGLKNFWNKTLLVLLTLFCTLFALIVVPYPAVASEPIALEIFGDGVDNPLSFTMTMLEDMDQYRHLYSTNNTWPTKSWYVAEGVELRKLLEQAEIREDAKLLRFTSKDNFRVNFTVRELLNEERYLFPLFRENDEYAGHIPGLPDRAEIVEPILALRDMDSDDFDDMGTKNALHLVFGQRAQTEQTNAIFAKYVTKIEVLTDDPGCWAAPIATPVPGEVAPGTMVKLNAAYDDTDKVHYTLDGSEPSVESPMYNWVASRWSNRSDFYEINHPIEIVEDTTIKAVVIGPGKYNSEIVTLEYNVVVGEIDVTGVNIVEGDQTLDMGKTVQLTAVVEPEYATDKSVTWSSDNEAVATVSALGLVSALSEGTATITVKTIDGDFSDTVTITVTAVPEFTVEAGVLTGYLGTGGDLIIPDDLGITAIGNNVFKDHTGLTSVTIPEGVTSIGKDAFNKCSNLETVAIPESVASIGQTSFMGCSKLGAIAISQNVTFLGNNAFNGCKSLLELTLPGSIGTIPTGAFDGCSSLNAVTFLEGITTINTRAFADCSSLTSVAFPESLIKIDSNAFNGCKKLAEIALPDTLEALGIGTFRGCSSLLTITIPGSVAIIPVSAFEDCTSLTEVIVSEGVTRINSWAFDGCRNLGKMFVPKSVGFISAISGCDQLTIYGYSGSYAETFATDKNIPFFTLSEPPYIVIPDDDDDVYTIGETADGIKTMTVNENQSGLKYFAVTIEPVKGHEGMETAVFTHLRGGVQLQLNALVADFDIVAAAKAGFNAGPGDVIKVYIVDGLTNDSNLNPIILQ